MEETHEKKRSVWKKIAFIASAVVAGIVTILLHRDRGQGLGGDTETLDKLGTGLDDIEVTTGRLEDITGTVGEELSNIGQSISRATETVGSAEDTVDRMSESLTSLQRILRKYDKE